VVVVPTPPGLDFTLAVSLGDEVGVWLPCDHSAAKATAPAPVRLAGALLDFGWRFGEATQAVFRIVVFHQQRQRCQSA
jgi:hypothetical protein